MKMFTPFRHFVHAPICLCLITTFSYGQPILNGNQQKYISTNIIQAKTAYTASSETDATNRIVTVDGHTYYHPRVVLIRQDGLSIRHESSDGMSAIAFIQLTNLPEDYQKKYGQDIQNQADEIKYENELKGRIIKAESENAVQDEQQKLAQHSAEPATDSSDINLGASVNHSINSNIDHGAYLAFEDNSVWEINLADVVRKKQWQKSASIDCRKTTALAIGYEYALTNTGNHEIAHAKYLGYAKRWIRENRGHGEYILLEDKSLFKTHLFDKMTALTWKSQEKMAIIKSDSSNEYDLILINVDEGETVRAKLDKWEFY
jgi:hypothetical protein